MKIKFKDLYKLITDGELLAITVDHYCYYEDGTVYSFINQGNIVIDKKENFEEVCKRYFDYYVCNLHSGIDGGICVGLEKNDDEI